MSYEYYKIENWSGMSSIPPGNPNPHRTRLTTNIFRINLSKKHIEGYSYLVERLWSDKSWNKSVELSCNIMDCGILLTEVEAFAEVL